MVRPSPARRYIHCTATRTIFRRPHEETSALSGTTCIIIAESAKQIALVSEPVSCCLEKGQVAADSDRDLGHAPAPPGIPTYLLNLFVNDLCPQCCSIAKPKCTSAQEQREREGEEIASVMKEEDSAVLQSRLNKKRKHPLGAQARPKNVLHSSSKWYHLN